MKRIGEISLEEDEAMNTAIRDNLMVPVTSFERHLFDIVDPETGELFSIDHIPLLINLIKEEHSVCSVCTKSLLGGWANAHPRGHSEFQEGANPSKII